MIRRLYALAFGLHFGVMQTSYFFQLEILLTAAYTGFIMATLGWLAGVLAGLFLPGGHRQGHGVNTPLAAWHLAGLAAYYAALALLSLYPYNLTLLPVYCLLIMVSGAQSGNFFKLNQPLFPSTASLFFMENNGFIIGWVAGFIGFVMFGIGFLHYGPVVIGAALVPMILLYSGSLRLNNSASSHPTGP